MTCHKKILLVLLLAASGLLPAIPSVAQTWNEWFAQKKTQIKYLEKQIAELQLYITDLEKGYQIAQKGLQVVSDLKHGDFALHSGYFTSLLNINPAVGQTSTVSDCESLLSAIAIVSQGLASRLNAPPVLSPPSQAYITSVLQSLQTRTAADRSDLVTLISDGQLSLHDSERQHRIDAIHADLVTQYRFIQRFSAQVSVFGIQRMQEQADGGAIQQFYGLP